MGVLAEMLHDPDTEDSGWNTRPRLARKSDDACATDACSGTAGNLYRAEGGDLPWLRADCRDPLQSAELKAQTEST